MFDEKTMPVQLRDFRDRLVAHDEYQSDLHGTLLEEDLGEAYRRIRTPSGELRGETSRGGPKFDLAYLQVCKSNSLWRVRRWEDAAAAISEAIEAFEGKPRLPKRE